MDKVKKQIQLNVSLIVFSCIVIYIMKSITLGRMAGLQDCAGADIVFTMITSLATTIIWRIVETIYGHFIYNIIVAFILIFFAIIYGIAISMAENTVVKEFIYISVGLFIIVYMIENIIIVRYLKNKQAINLTYFGYTRERWQWNY